MIQTETHQQISIKNKFLTFLRRKFINFWYNYSTGKKCLICCILILYFQLVLGIKSKYDYESNKAAAFNAHIDHLLESQINVIKTTKNPLFIRDYTTTQKPTTTEPPPTQRPVPKDYKKRALTSIGGALYWKKLAEVSEKLAETQELRNVLNATTHENSNNHENSFKNRENQETDKKETFHSIRERFLDQYLPSTAKHDHGENLLTGPDIFHSVKEEVFGEFKTALKHDINGKTSSPEPENAVNSQSTNLKSKSIDDLLKIELITGIDLVDHFEDEEKNQNSKWDFAELKNTQNLESCVRQLPSVFKGTIPLVQQLKLKKIQDFSQETKWPELINQINENTTNSKLNNPIIDGCWAPKTCIPDQYLTVIVPFRNRWPQLDPFLLVMHRLLQQQLRAYCMVLVEQFDNGQFNRAKLMNVGVIQMQNHQFFKKLHLRYGEKGKLLLPQIEIINNNGNDNSYGQKSTLLLDRPNCYSFHDVDHLPEDDRNLFACLENQGIHQADRLNKMDYKTQYSKGHKVPTAGCVLISDRQYKKVNGHANIFFGWGAEDIEMSLRLRKDPGFDERSLARNYNSSYGEVVRELEKIILTGVTDEGGGPGYTRMDKYGIYYNLPHNHGFTSGPIMLKSHTDKMRASKNEYDRHDHKNKKLLHDISKYDVVPSPFSASILRKLVNYFQEISELEDWPENTNLINKKYPNGHEFKVDHFDGLVDTYFGDLGYFPHALFGRFLIDVRPAEILNFSVSKIDEEMELDDELLMEAKPDQILRSEKDEETKSISVEGNSNPNNPFFGCNYVKYPNSTLLHYEELANFDPSIVKELKFNSATYNDRLNFGQKRCQTMQKVELGECNGFNIVKPSQGYEMPHPLRSFYPSEEFFSFQNLNFQNLENTNKYDMFDTHIKNCPGKMGQFQAIEKPLEIDYSQESQESSSQSISLEFYYNLKLRQVPPGGFIYTDHLHYEGQHHSTRILQIGNTTDFQIPFNIKVDNLKKFSDPKQNLKIYLTGTDKNLSFKIDLQIKNVKPGFYLMHINILDYLSQPYIDQNIIFRVLDSDKNRNKLFHQKREETYDQIQENLFHNETYLHNIYNFQDPGWNLLIDQKFLDDTRVEYLIHLARSYGYDFSDYDKIIEEKLEQKICPISAYGHSKQTILPDCHRKDKLCSFVKEMNDRTDLTNVVKYCKKKWGQRLSQACPAE